MKYWPLRTPLCLFAFALLMTAALPSALADPFPGTRPLEMTGDLASGMLDGVHRFLSHQTETSIAKREAHYHRDFSSAEAYAHSLEPNRRRLAKIIGATDPRTEFDGLQYVSSTSQPAHVGRGHGFEVFAVRWPVFRGVEGEGLLLNPVGRPIVADLVAVPDAGQSPEQIAGLVEGVPREGQFARRLAEAGCRVVVPVIIDRGSDFSRRPDGRPTGLPHREFLYRPAFELGRHIIGYEVQKLLALVDWFEQQPETRRRAGIIGYGEGGLLALYAAAIDPRIDVVCVSGYFGPREGLWQEPIDRNVFGLLEQFGDAELAAMVFPRKLIVEHGMAPAWRHEDGGTPGELARPAGHQVRGELDRAEQLVSPLGRESAFELFAGDPSTPPGSPSALRALLRGLKADSSLVEAASEPIFGWPAYDPEERMRRAFDQINDDTQTLLVESESTREKFWSRAQSSGAAADAWTEQTRWYRDYFAEEVIGQFDQPLLPPEVRTRKIFDEASYTGHEVVMDVLPDVFAYGILLVPKNIPSGERRPVVVCQHGLESRPQDVADPRVDHPAYHRFACQLAERGFVTYAPQNLYIFGDRFRSLQRKLNPLKKTLFSVIAPQHEQATAWLASLPMVDPERIAFYGLSYGGKTAMRVPALVDRYCLSICSADFNEWVWKNASTRSAYSYVFSGEYEIFEFDLGGTFNYAEMARLIAPRPFMVERGHRDTVAPDHRVAYEYAKVRLLYADLKIPKRTTIEFFDGPHTIHGVGTFDFLHQHLDWPAPPETER